MVAPGAEAMIDLDALCKCGHTRDEHDHSGYCTALNSLVTCECTRFEEASEP